MPLPFLDKTHALHVFKRVRARTTSSAKSMSTRDVVNTVDEGPSTASVSVYSTGVEDEDEDPVPRSSIEEKREGQFFDNLDLDLDITVADADDDSVRLCF